MNCWEAQPELSDGTCKSSQLSMAHGTFQRRISVVFCTYLAIKVLRVLSGTFPEAFIYPLHGYIIIHSALLGGYRTRRKGIFILSWFGFLVCQRQVDFAQPIRLVQSVGHLRLPNVHDLGAWEMLQKGNYAQLLRSVWNSGTVRYFLDSCCKA